MAQGSANDARLETFASLLRAQRLAARLTQEQLAERAGLSLRAIQNLERGDRRPYPDTTQRLTAALELEGDARAAFEGAARPKPRSRSADARAPSPVAAVATNVPSPLTACIGRESELTTLRQAIRERRLVTLFGPGGSGKTRLAVQFGIELARAPDTAALFEDGIWLVELDAIHEVALIPHAVAAVVGVFEEPGRRLVDTLADALRERRLLLLMDNCEHLLVGCVELLETLLSRCADLRVVATSRQPLMLPGELVRPVRPLSVPDSDAPHEALMESASMQLFVDRARAAIVGLELTPSMAECMAAICRRLEGVPLALELAAARLRALSLPDLLDRLDAPFGVLSGSAGRPARHRSLRATIDWSFALLDEPRRRLARQLSVFSGGWTLEATQVVCGDVTADGLVDLVDHSLVQVDWRQEGGPRYRLLETVRQYLWQQLEAAGEASAVRDAHLSFYSRFAEAARTGLGGPEQVDWLRRLDAERGNLRGALQWAFGRQDPVPGVRLAAALGTYWDLRGDRSEGLSRLEQALGVDDGSDASLRARLVRAAGQLALGMRDEQAAGWLEESLAVSRASGDQVNQLATLVQLGRVWIDEANIPRAVVTLEEARALASAAGDAAGLASALSALGQAHLDAGDYVISTQLLEQSLELSRQLGDRIGQAATLLQLAMGQLEIGDAQSAQAAVEEAQRLLLQIGDAVGVAWTEHDLARVALDMGDFERAADLFDSSMRLFQSLGHTTALAQSMHGLGRARLALGDDESAVRLFREGVELFRRIGHDRGRGWGLYNLAWVAAQHGRADEAWGLLVEGFDVFRATAYPAGTAACLLAAALVVVRDDASRAARWLGMADRLQHISRVDVQRVELVAEIGAKHMGQSRFDAERSLAHGLSSAERESELDQLITAHAVG